MCCVTSLARAAYLSYPHLSEVMGGELAPSRYAIAEAAVTRLLRYNRKRFRLHAWKPGYEISVCEDCGSAAASSSSSSTATPSADGGGGGSSSVGTSASASSSGSSGGGGGGV